MADPLVPVTALVPTTLDTDRKPWQRLEGEPNRAFHSFTHFRDLAPWERSIHRAYTNHQLICKKKSIDPPRILTCSPDWRGYSFKWSWRERAGLHDSDVAERERERRLRDVEAMNVRHQGLAIALQNLAIARLQQIADSKAILAMSPRELAVVIDRASKVERAARGAATVITSTVKTPDGAAADQPLNLSKLTDSELAEFEQLLIKAKP